jgi:hypothetical protein
MTLRRDIRRAERRVQAAQRAMAAMTIWERKNVKFWMHDVKYQDFRYRAEKTTQLVRP